MRHFNFTTKKTLTVKYLKDRYKVWVDQINFLTVKIFWFKPLKKKKVGSQSGHSLQVIMIEGKTTLTGKLYSLCTWRSLSLSLSLYIIRYIYLVTKYLLFQLCILYNTIKRKRLRSLCSWIIKFTGSKRTNMRRHQQISIDSECSKTRKILQ